MQAIIWTDEVKKKRSVKFLIKPRSSSKWLNHWLREKKVFILDAVAGPIPDEAAKAELNEEETQKVNDWRNVQIRQIQNGRK
jgi:hypothetical protein